MATTSEFVIDANTVALYHMNGTVGSAGKRDNAEGTPGRDLTEVGTLTSATGNIVVTTDGAYQSASGASNYITFTPGMGTGAFTVEGWVYASAYTLGEVLISSFNLTNYYQIAVDSSDNTRLRIEVNPSDGVTTGYITAPSTGTWHYLAVTYDRSGSNSVKVYLNGSPVTYTIIGGTNSRTGTMTDGLTRLFRNSGGSGVTNTYRFDELRFSNTARSASEIFAYYNDPVSSSPESLVIASFIPVPAPQTIVITSTVNPVTITTKENIWTNDTQTATPTWVNDTQS